MKHSILILIGCALAISPLGAEDDKKTDQKGDRAKAAGKGAPAKGGPRDGSFFKEIDKDGDNAISKEEAGERWERMSKLDKNEDGKVTMQELAAGRGGPSDRPRPDGKGGPGKGAPGDMFKRADKNSDGKISKDEVPAEAWARLSKLDKNGDNAISGEEAKAGAPGGSGGPGKGGADFLKRADKNGDGNISKDEVPEQAWERLGKLDKNEDGSVSKAEMAAGMAAMRGGDKGKGKGGPDGGPSAIFGRFDENKDDKLSESEVPAEMWSKLRKADSDADGLVSKKELGKVYGGRDGADTPPKKKPEPKKDEA